MILDYIFWIGVLGVLHSYLFYPIILHLWPTKKRALQAYSTQDALPEVSVIFAAYNEESVIEEKINSIYQSNYPLDKISVWVGSDCSTDQTEDIIEKLRVKYSSLHLYRSPSRMGKSGIINHLASQINTDIYIGTDANIIFSPDLIFQLISPLKDPNVQLVGGNISYDKPSNRGIAKQEDQYLGYENFIKTNESRAFQQVMGVEGGCYAIKTKAFVPIPPLTFMEDFYITMKVIQNKGVTLFNPKAICFEDVSTDWKEEYKRKVRISIGNFQNLARFKAFLFSWPTGFLFLSHKLLRWISPLLLILITISSVWLAFNNPFYLFFSILQIVVILSIIVDLQFLKRGKNVFGLRLFTHFTLMNTALLEGLIKYSKGISTNVWQPTKRNQQKT